MQYILPCEDKKYITRSLGSRKAKNQRGGVRERNLYTGSRKQES